MNGSGGFEALLPLMLISIVSAIPVWWITPKMGARRWLWTTLHIVPLVNFFALMVFWFRVAGAILDKLNAISEDLKQNAPPK